MTVHLPLHVAYGGLALLTSLINNIFLLFYVSTFVTIFDIDSTSFYIGETIFLIWNSVNDPFFGWLSDSGTLKESKGKDKTDIVMKRIDALSKFGPLFTVSFLLFWFKVMPIALQFTIALCLYDSFLTMVDLHHQALLADITIDAKDRVKLNSYCSAFSAAGSLSVFISYALWDKNDMMKFQMYCLFIALFACFGFYICCKSLKKYYKENHFSKKNDEETKNTVGDFSVVKKYTSQVLKHRNFLLFSAMNLVQVFHCHFNSNFFPLFIHQLLGHILTPTQGAMLLGFSFLVPHINNLYFLHLCKRYGSYNIIKTLFIIKLVLALLMWTLGMNYWYLLCMFIVSNRVFTEGTCRLLNLVISDLVDEDFVKFRRQSPVSALVFGTAALLSKPGQTLAPLIGSYLIYLQTGKSLFMDQDSANLKIHSQSGATHGDDDRFKEGCFVVLIVIPVVCALVQLFVWQLFSLKGRYLKDVKFARANLEEKLLMGIVV